jgi:hypothetical protein
LRLGGASAPQPRAQGWIYVGVVALENAEFEFVGSGSWVAGMDGGSFDQMVAPDSGEQKWPRDRAANSAWVVLYSEFTEILWADAGGFWVIPAAADCDGGI